MAGRKLGDASYYVARRLGRAISTHTLVPEACPLVAVLLDGSYGGAVLLQLMKARRLWVPHRPELLALVVEPQEPSEPRASASGQLARALDLPSLVLPPGPLSQYAAAAQLAGAQALLLGDCLEDRAAVVFASILLDGKLASLPFGQVLDGMTVGRPLGAVMHQRLLEAGTELETPEAFDDRASRATDRRLALLEDYLSFMPGSRLDLLTNIAQSPDRVQDGYLT